MCGDKSDDGDDDGRNVDDDDDDDHDDYDDDGENSDRNDGDGDDDRCCVCPAKLSLETSLQILFIPSWLQLKRTNQDKADFEAVRQDNI